MKAWFACAAVLALVGCSSDGGHPASVRANAVASNDNCPSTWTRVRCAGTDSQCIQRQMDQMKLYTACHKKHG
ncbi:hypothetical protein [Carnimonas bestiolae]|uniref:hypothetical protein n=1 Tax=Carnimonas bestiolae TaxID=3402172 RepID=UPI003EDBAE1C